MPNRAQRFGASIPNHGLPTKAVRVLPMVFALTGIAIVALTPGNGLVALSTMTVVAAGLYFTTAAPAALARLRVPDKIIEEHKLLVESIESAPIPFAVYDQEDCLIVCNESYEDLYGDVFRVLRHRNPRRSIHYADLVREFSAGTMPAGELDAYVEERWRAQRSADGTAIDRLYSGFGWLRVTKFATPSGAVAGFAVDINEIKQRETALQAQIEKSKSLESKLRALANTDPLTELPNRRAFFERLEVEFARTDRYGSPLSVVMMDIDRFKSINDVHGHSFGDLVITRLATTAAVALRAHVDLMGRVGGEEFAILLPATCSDGARECAERICSAIAALEFDAGGEMLQVTASFGMSTVLATDRCHSESLSRADGALYQAKAGGRSRVVVWQPKTV